MPIEKKTWMVGDEVDWRIALGDLLGEAGVPAVFYATRLDVTDQEVDALKEIREQCDELIKHREW